MVSKPSSLNLATYWGNLHLSKTIDAPFPTRYSASELVLTWSLRVSSSCKMSLIGPGQRHFRGSSNDFHFVAVGL